jgi:uncharacterized membrane protein YqjE
MSGREQSLKSLGAELIDEIAHLVRQELRLAQAEAVEKTTQVQNGIVSVAVGLVLAAAALLILLQALVIGLSNVMPAWAASVVVGVVVAIVGFGLVRYGQTNLQAKNLLPARTIRSVRSDRDLAMERAE